MPKYLLIRKRSETETMYYRVEVSFDVSTGCFRQFQLLHDPADHRSYRSLQKRTATLANRRQFDTSPATHTRFIQLAALRKAGGKAGSGGRCLGQMSGLDAAYKVLSEASHR